MQPFALLSLALAAALAATPVGAHEIRGGSLVIEHPWAPATANPQEIGAVYMIIHNQGDQPDRLLGARSSEAQAATLHTTTVSSEGVARMRPAGAVAVPPHGEVRLAPGGLHVMLTGLTTQLFEGVAFPLTLLFERAGAVDVEVEVQGSRAPTEHGAHRH